MRGSPREVGTGSLIWFFVLSFAWTWGISAIMTFFREQVEAATGPIGYHNPVFILAVWGPAIAAFALILYHFGPKGLGAYLRRLTLWRMHWGWWVLLIFAMPVSSYVGAAVHGGIEPFPFSPWHAVFPALLMTLIIGPVEEFGWRGFALPLLQRRMAPIWATVILGFIWAIWHYPAFVIEGTPQSEHGGFPPAFVVAAIILSITFTAMFNASRGSLLVPVLFHFQLNNDALPDGGLVGMLILILIAVAVVWITRDRMFRRDGGVTDLLMPEDSDATASGRSGPAG